MASIAGSSSGLWDCDDTVSRPFRTRTVPRPTRAVVLSVPPTIATAAPTAALPPWPRPITRSPAAVTISSADVAATSRSPVDTSRLPPSISALTVESALTIANMPPSDEPALTTTSPAANVKSRDASTAVTDAAPLAVSVESTTVASVVAVTWFHAKAKPTPRHRPPAAPPAGEKLARNEPAADQVVSRVVAATDRPPSVVAVTLSIVAFVVVVIVATVTEPATCTFVPVFCRGCIAPLPLAACAPIFRSFVAEASRVNPVSVARRTDAITVDSASMIAAEPARLAELPSPVVLSIAAAPPIAWMTVVFLAETSSLAGGTLDDVYPAIVPEVLTVARTSSFTAAKVKSPETARPNAPCGWLPAP